MKQTSLLDSFIKRQHNRKDDAEQSDAKAHKMAQQTPQKPEINIKKMKKNNKLNIDSDEELEMSEIRNQIEEMSVDHDSDGHRKQSGKKKQRESKANVTKIKPVILQNEDKEDADPLAHFTDATPKWAQKQYCKDKNKRSPDHPEYDPTTLYVPEEAWSNFTAPMKQFWRIKSDNYDKVILFKLGKFYEMFYDDAAVGNQYLGLKYMGTKMHTGFPQKCLQKYAQQLVQLGFKTVIVEQMETPDQMQARINQDKKNGRKSDKTINREVTQILTKGTFNKNQNDDVYLPNYLLSIRAFGDTYAFSLLQISTNQISMGVVDSIEKFKTVLYQTRPVEAVYDPDNLNFEVCRMMEKTFLGMQLSKVYNKNNLWHPLNALSELDRMEKEDKLKKSKVFSVIDQSAEMNKNLMYSTLSGMFDYLKKVFKFDYVISAVRFTFYQKDQHSRNMILDSQALQHLQIFQTSEGTRGSLFETIDRTKTKFGKRLLRKWLMSPLMNQFHINQRLNAVQDIQKIGLERDRVNQILRKLPDLDKKVNRLYHYAIKTTSASKAVYFEDLNTARMKEFKQLMEKLEDAWDAITILSKCRSGFKSHRLKQLVTLDSLAKIPEDQIYAEDEDDQSTFEGLLPDVMANLEQFRSYIKWENNTPVPQKGLVAFFDELQDELERQKAQLEKYLDNLRFELQEPNLKFTHTKQRYEVEIPEKSQKKRPKDFEFSSKRAGFSRYICPAIKKMVKSLEKTEEDIKEQMGLFIGFFFAQFKKKQKIWQRFVEIVAEVDCLISLSEYSFLNHKVRPNFTANTFQIRQARHPCLTHIQFIPNDISMRQKVMLLTGPNMGGKSTILRTVCCLSILAQMGCYVPASSYNCETVDRIFTRIGASDKLQLGKSTFFIEMEETKSVLVSATPKSLAIMDELGRGTSTFDGLAIAYSVLQHIIEQLGCYCLFATHYHILIDQFQANPAVCLMMMDSLIKEDQIMFLYKLVRGSVAKSFGLSVARKVGISEDTIQVAEAQAQAMNQFMDGKRRAALEKMHRFAQGQE